MTQGLVIIACVKGLEAKFKILCPGGNRTEEQSQPDRKAEQCPISHMTLEGLVQINAHERKVIDLNVDVKRLFGWLEA
jgi:hypothetical protein